MRVLHAVESKALGGAEKLAVTLAEGLSARGYEPLYAAPPGSWLEEHARTLGRRCITLPARRRSDIAFLRWLAALIRKEKISFVHAHLMAMNLYGTTAAKLARVPSIATFHGRHYDFERLRRRLVYRVISFTAKKIVAVSDELAQALTKEAHISSQRIRVIPNGVDLSHFRPRNDASSHRQAASIIAVGSLTEVKGHAYLIEAFAAVRRDFPQAVLTIVGDGPLREDLLGQVRSLQLEDAVRFLGRRQDVAELLAAADIFALPSLSEGQALSIMEAMATGLPVVATQVGGNEEIIQQRETGLLVPAKSTGQLAAAICLLLSDPPLMRKMGQAGRNRAREHFSLESMLDAYENLYRELLGHNKASLSSQKETP